MPTTVNEQVVDEVTGIKFQNLGALHGLTAGLAGQYALESFRRQNDMAASVMTNAMNAAQQIASNGGMLAQAMMGRVARMVLDTSAEQAVAFSEQIRADLSSQLSDMNTVLADLQGQAKIAQTTPPQTGTGGAFGSAPGSALFQQMLEGQAALAGQNATIITLLEKIAAK